MDKSKRTPGPLGYQKLGNDADQCAIYDESGRTIGLSYHGEANAALFAASSEMREALKSTNIALFYLMQISKEVGTVGQLSKIVEMNRAAIAKAKEISK